MNHWLFLQNCTLVDATVPRARPGMAVLLEEDRIKAVASSGELRPQAHYHHIDLHGQALLPGLWDVHCHPGVYYPDPHAVSLFETEAERTLRALRNLTDALKAGMTALRVGGEACYIDVALRDGFAGGRLVGPRLWTCGPPLRATGGHGAYRRRWAVHLDAPVRDSFPSTDPWGSMEVDGADAFRRRARLNVKMGVDWIKVMVTGGIAGDSETMQELQVTADEISAAVEVAHGKGLKVMTHLGGPDAVRLAVTCGVDSVEHGYCLDEDAAALMAAKGVWYVPTLSVTHSEEYMLRMGWSDMAIEKARTAAPKHREAFGMARAAGVWMANGSDLHPLKYSTVGEIVQWVRCGMSEWEAILGATRSAAELCGAEADLGTIEPGKKADLIVMPDSPLQDVQHLCAVRMVIQNGRIVHRAEEGGEPYMGALQSLIGEYLAFVFESDPIDATHLGIHDFDHQLGELAPDAFAERATKRQRFLDRFRTIDPASLDADEQMDLRVAVLDLETALRRHHDLRVWERAPYWYLERLGGALSNLIGRDFAPAEERGRRLLSRLQGAPAYLRAASGNLTDQSPPVYIDMGLTSARGLTSFLSEAVLGFSADLPPALRSDVCQAVKGAQSGLADFARFLQGLRLRAQGHYACGVEHFDFLLQRFHLLDMDHHSLYEFGLERMAADKERLEAYARDQDPSRSWVEQIDRAKEDHPQPEEFKDSYEREMVLAREHCVEEDLITLPKGEVCIMEWLPAYLRASLPIAVMNTSPPFEAGLESKWLITPLDPEATPERQRQHMRDNCYVFARSIALHEIYPGHHLQKVHHKLATQDSPMRRYFSSPVFTEGWGLYTEDLLEETGFIHEPPVMLFKLRNALWRSVRVVIDSGLHTRDMSFEEAVRLLRDEVFLDAHMAEGEVRRYTTHNNPTYPSSYLVGKTLIQDLRERWCQRQGGAYSLKAFHDRLLSFGSPPVRLVRDRMLE